MSQPRAKIRHCSLKDANDFVAAHHRHHKPARGHRFSIKLCQENETIGVAIIGRPVARFDNLETTVEITRLATNGAPNACSQLLGAAARAASALGYDKIQTYTLDTEPGTSLRAAGFTMERITRGGAWNHTDKKPRRTDQPTCQKQKWMRQLT
jgi:hypothetical protein